jgi:N-acyl-D-aspartate/D-glutamate deacylase
MPYDLLIKNGVLIDGSGLPRYRMGSALPSS